MVCTGADQTAARPAQKSVKKLKGLCGGGRGAEDSRIGDDTDEALQYWF